MGFDMSELGFSPAQKSRGPAGSTLNTWIASAEGQEAGRVAGEVGARGGIFLLSKSLLPALGPQGNLWCRNLIF